MENFQQASGTVKVEEKRENFSLRKLRNPEKEKENENDILLPFLKFPIQKGRTFL
jgi:hypothetical protein